MNRWLLSLCCTACMATAAAQSSPYFLSDPCLSPDGSTIVFAYEGDLWKADMATGNAARITAMEGYESNPRISPDGKWLAFTGRQKGNADVYLVSMDGGAIRQLSWHSANDVVDSWSWDSKYIYFTSNRYSRSGAYKLSVNGGTPLKVFGDDFFLYDHDCWESPVSDELYFSDSWESSLQAQRKRYKGPFNPDIQSYNPETKKLTKYTNWIGKDFSASLDKKGNLYFISDEENGEYNLYTLKGNQKKALTHFSTSIKSPLVSANGSKVVFEKDYQLWVYDVAKGSSNRLPISITRNDVLPAEKDFDVRGNITAFDVSPDGKKMAFVSRGELFVSDVDGKFIKKLNRGSTERVEEVNWMKDNLTLLFNQTSAGYTNWYTMQVNDEGSLKEITRENRNNRSLTLNEERTMAVYLSGRDELRLLDLKNMKSKTLVKDEIWGIESSGPRFSPNDEFVIYTAHRHFEEDIFIYQLASGKTYNLSKTDVTETDPYWSPDGKYIYFTSQLLKASYPFGMPDAHVYRLPLQKFETPFRAKEWDDLFSAKDEKKENGKKDSAAKKEIKPIEIDSSRLMERIGRVSPDFGAQYLLAVFQKGDKTTVLYSSNHDQGRFSLWKTVFEPFEQPKTEKIAGAEGRSFGLAAVNGKYYLLSRGNIAKLNLDANKLEPIAINYTFRRNLASEFSQMFYEAWAQLQENYYDEHFHGVDWAKMKTYYSSFLPYLNNRADLRTLLNDMLGELNSSHQGFSSSGADESVPLAAATMETGILFKNENPFVVDRILQRSPADRNDIQLQEGDRLLMVNNERIDPKANRNMYFTLPSRDGEISLRFDRNGKTIDVRIHPEASLVNYFYDDWIDGNQARVDKESRGRIAYSCMKNMGDEELESFIIDMTRELNEKDGLILDLRYNTGGNVHDKVLQFLSQRSYLQWKYRQGSFTPQPNFAPSDKPIVLLINEQSLSDAEMTAQGFKALKLGTIIGNESYHWIIFTGGSGLVDGSFVRMPAWGCYTLDGKDLEHTGVAPDIKVINSFVDKMEHRDPQIDRAVQEIMKQLK